MARQKKKKGSLVKRLLIIAGALAVVQVILILFFEQQTNPTTIREEIARKADQTKGITAQRRELLKIQLAINDYRIENGRLPNTLDELIPRYFDRAPVDPETSQPFKYAVDGNKFTLGEKPSTTAVAASAGGSAAAGSSKVGDETAEQLALIATLDKKVDDTEYVYDPTNKREPFRPFEMKLVQNGDCAKQPLTCFDLGQLRLTAVMTGLDVPKASVEDATGKGYLIGVGAKIGINGGEVAAILPDRIKIVETTTDIVTGEKKHTVIDMELRTKDLQDAKSPAPRALRPDR